MSVVAPCRSKRRVAAADDVGPLFGSSRVRVEGSNADGTPSLAQRPPAQPLPFRIAERPPWFAGKLN